MGHEEQVSPGDTDQRSFYVSEQSYSGLSLLLYAHHSAHNAQRPSREFAVGIDELEHVGIRKADLRWLVAMHFVDHFIEVPALLFGCELLPSPSLRLSGQSCFAFTEAGAAFAVQLLDNGANEFLPIALAPVSGSPTVRQTKPSWDNTHRQLSFGGIVIRRFHRRVCSQELIVVAFHEQDFADEIDDPIPPKSGNDSKERLSKVVYRLNMSIDPKLIRFECNSQRTRIHWESVETAGKRNRDAPERTFQATPSSDESSLRSQSR